MSYMAGKLVDEKSLDVSFYGLPLMISVPTDHGTVPDSPHTMTNCTTSGGATCDVTMAVNCHCADGIVSSKLTVDSQRYDQG